MKKKKSTRGYNSRFSVSCFILIPVCKVSNVDGTHRVRRARQRFMLRCIKNTSFTMVIFHVHRFFFPLNLLRESSDHVFFSDLLVKYTLGYSGVQPWEHLHRYSRVTAWSSSK